MRSSFQCCRVVLAGFEDMVMVRSDSVQHLKSFISITVTRIPMLQTETASRA